MSRRAKVQKFVVRARKGQKCRFCGKPLRCRGYLGPGEKLLSELVYTPGMTIRTIKEEIRKRGWSCRKCLGSTGRTDPKASGNEILKGATESRPESVGERAQRIYREQLAKLAEIQGCPAAGEGCK